MADHSRDKQIPAKATVPPASGVSEDSPALTGSKPPMHVRFPKTWAVNSWSPGAWSDGAWGNGAFK
jgi:hypothetical protein